MPATCAATTATWKGRSRGSRKSWPSAITRRAPAAGSRRRARNRVGHVPGHRRREAGREASASSTSTPTSTCAADEPAELRHAVRPDGEVVRGERPAVPLPVPRRRGAVEHRGPVRAGRRTRGRRACLTIDLSSRGTGPHPRHVDEVRRVGRSRSPERRSRRAARRGDAGGERPGRPAGPARSSVEASLSAASCVDGRRSRSISWNSTPHSTPDGNARAGRRPPRVGRRQGVGTSGEELHMTFTRNDPSRVDPRAARHASSRARAGRPKPRCGCS